MVLQSYNTSVDKGPVWVAVFLYMISITDWFPTRLVQYYLCRESSSCGTCIWYLRYLSYTNDEYFGSLQSFVHYVPMWKHGTPNHCRMENSHQQGSLSPWKTKIAEKKWLRKTTLSTFLFKWCFFRGTFGNFLGDNSRNGNLLLHGRFIIC